MTALIIATSFPGYVEIMQSLGAAIPGRAARLMIIAIDGPAASGKGTLARQLAAHYGLNHLDTGSLYRAVGLAVMRAGGDPADRREAVETARSMEINRFDDDELRAEGVGEAASIVAAMPEVRDIMLERQRALPPRRPAPCSMGVTLAPSSAPMPM